LHENLKRRQIRLKIDDMLHSIKQAEANAN
jgi:hypothetical protein